MIVCVCKGVRCSSVRAAIRDGASTADDVAEACGAGTDCGACVGTIEDFLEEERGCPRRAARASLPLLDRSAA